MSPVTTKLRKGDIGLPFVSPSVHPSIHLSICLLFDLVEITITQSQISSSSSVFAPSRVGLPRWLVLTSSISCAVFISQIKATLGGQCGCFDAVTLKQAILAIFSRGCVIKCCFIRLRISGRSFFNFVASSLPWILQFLPTLIT